MSNTSFSKLKTNWKRLSRRIFSFDGSDALNDANSKNKGKKSGGEKSDASLSEIDQEILALIAENDFLVNGKVSLVNLGRIKEKLGAKWPKYSEFVHEFAEKVIERRITSQDLFYRVGEDVYVFVFARLSEEEAIIKCSLIAKEIGEQIFGDAWSSDEYGASIAVTKTDGSVVFEEKSIKDSIAKSLLTASTVNPKNALHAITPETANKSLEDIAARIDAIAMPGGDTDAESDPEKLLQNFRVMMSGVDDIVSHFNDTTELVALNKDTPQWKSFIHDSKNAGNISVSNISQKLNALISDTEKLYENIQDTVVPSLELQAKIIAGEDGEDGMDEADMEFYYWPVLQPAVSAIHSYRLTSEIKLDKSQWSIEELPEEFEPATIAALDRLLLQRAIADLLDCRDNGLLNIIIIPVHFSTLNISTHRQAYVRICSRIPKDMRKLIMWEIINSGAGLWHSQLQNAVSAVKRFGRLVALEVDSKNPRFTDLKAIGMDVVGFNCQKMGISDRDLQARLPIFIKRAVQEGLRSYAFGIEAKPLLFAALKANFDFVAGATVASNVQHPEGVKEYNTLAGEFTLNK